MSYLFGWVFMPSIHPFQLSIHVVSCARESYVIIIYLCEMVIAFHDRHAEVFFKWRNQCY